MFGGEGDAISGFADSWDPDLAGEVLEVWMSRQLLAGAFIDVEHLVSVVDGVMRSGASISMPAVVVTPRPAPPA